MHVIRMQMFPASEEKKEVSGGEHLLLLIDLHRPALSPGLPPSSQWQFTAVEVSGSHQGGESKGHESEWWP